MAKGMKTGGRNFPPGNNANPLGPAAHNPAKRAMKRLTTDDLQDIGSLILKGDLPSLQAVAKDPTATVLRVWLASIAVKAINKGDPAALNMILDRLVGKPKAHVELTGSVAQGPQVVITLPDNGRTVIDIPATGSTVSLPSESS